MLVKQPDDQLAQHYNSRVMKHECDDQFHGGVTIKLLMDTSQPTQVEEANLRSPRHVHVHRQPGIDHHFEIANDVSGFDNTGASTHGTTARRHLPEIGRVLLAFNCRRFDAHQPLTSTQQSLRVDTIQGTSAGGQCSSPCMPSANR